MHENNDGERILSWREVQPLAGNIGRVTAWRWANDEDNKFPAPVRLSAGRVGWRLSDIVAWQAGLGAPDDAA
jgi:prophage regulatory protein